MYEQNDLYDLESISSQRIDKLIGLLLQESSSRIRELFWWRYLYTSVDIMDCGELCSSPYHSLDICTCRVLVKKEDKTETDSRTGGSVPKVLTQHTYFIFRCFCSILIILMWVISRIWHFLFYMNTNYRFSGFSLISTKWSIKVFLFHLKYGTLKNTDSNLCYIQY